MAFSQLIVAPPRPTRSFIDSVVGEGGADQLYEQDGSAALNSRDGVSGNDRLDGGVRTDTRVTDSREASIVGFP